LLDRTWFSIFAVIGKNTVCSVFLSEIVFSSFEFLSEFVVIFSRKEVEILCHTKDLKAEYFQCRDWEKNFKVWIFFLDYYILLIVACTVASPSVTPLIFISLLVAGLEGPEGVAFLGGVPKFEEEEELGVLPHPARRNRLNKAAIPKSFFIGSTSKE
jgi:hypothetical protein